MKNKKGGHPRIQCPVCGYLAWISSFDRDYPLEVKVQFMRGGRANPHFVEYRSVFDHAFLEDVRKFLIARLKIVLNRLKGGVTHVLEASGVEFGDYGYEYEKECGYEGVETNSMEVEYD